MTALHKYPQVKQPLLNQSNWWDHKLTADIIMYYRWTWVRSAWGGLAGDWWRVAFLQARALGRHPAAGHRAAVTLTADLSHNTSAFIYLGLAFFFLRKMYKVIVNILFFKWLHFKYVRFIISAKISEISFRYLCQSVITLVLVTLENLTLACSSSLGIRAMIG